MALDLFFYRSNEWGQYKRALEARLEYLRKKNDNPTLDLDATSTLRGQIKEIKRQLQDAERVLNPDGKNPPADE